jgi:predicted nuclease with TOPRIM domain
MGHVTKEELAEINEELTETLQRLDEENAELMEQEKNTTIDTIKQERRKLLRELRRKKDKIEDAQEAMSDGVTDLRTLTVFRIVMAGLLSGTAVSAALWANAAGIRPKMATLTGVGMMVFVLVMRFLLRWARSR